MSYSHPNAHFLKRLTELAEVSDTPWEYFEYYNKDLDTWMPKFMFKPF